ncbi:acyltransferase family protein [Aureimonas sp. ME7]|uniref:acyltransferase family protein n=1 Tax=Aureimonas sp. ME7 TaxID=2744252 RepID=UPI0015FD83B7|nr:acyltransferase family protein [Aureimonas sp. ME7]
MGRLWDLERAKVLAIFLVVVGHIFGYAPPVGGEWWFIPESYIYLFHMPLFMFLSGFVFGLKRYDDLRLRDFPGYVRARAERLLIPFMAMAIIIIAGKTVARDVAGVSLSDQTLGQNVLGVLGHYGFAASPVQFIWYLFVVFLFSIMTALLCGIGKIPVPAVLLAAGILFLIDVPDIYYLFYVGKFYLFFMLGVVCCHRRERAYDLVDRHALAFHAAFLLASAVFFVSFWDLREFYASRFWILVMSATAIPSIIAFMRSGWATRQEWLTYLSGYVFIIYLFNVPFIGFAKEVIKRAIPYTNEYMILYAPILVGAGFVGPIVLRKLVFERWSYLRRMTA